MTLVVVTALPLREGEDAEALATKVADAVVAATGGRDGDGVQGWTETDLEPRKALARATRSIAVHNLPPAANA